jgi:hypothetical protein
VTRRLCRITVTLTEGLSFLSAFLVPKANKNKICDTPCHSYHDRLLQSEKRLRRRIAKPSLIGIAPCRCSFPPRGTGFELELVRPAKNASLFSQLSLVLCVSRACLGKVIVVSTEGKGWLVRGQGLTPNRFSKRPHTQEDQPSFCVCSGHLCPTPGFVCLDKLMTRVTASQPVFRSTGAG